MFNVPRTGFADLPLHGGNAPRWLFTRMVKLATAISDVIVIEYGTEELKQKCRTGGESISSAYGQIRGRGVLYGTWLFLSAALKDQTQSLREISRTWSEKNIAEDQVLEE